MTREYDELLLSIKDKKLRNEITNKFMELEGRIIDLEEKVREARDKNRVLDNRCSYKQARINLLEEMIKGVISDRID